MKEFKHKSISGVVIDGTKIQRYAEAIEKIEQEVGEITPAEIVRRAENPDSVLHDVFEWDNSIAGQKWRIQQARLLMKSIEVVIHFENRDVRVPAFHNVIIQTEDESPSKRFYASWETVESNNQMKEFIIRKALNEADGWVKRYQTYQELLPIAVAVSKVKKQIKKKLENKNQ